MKERWSAAIAAPSREEFFATAKEADPHSYVVMYDKLECYDLGPPHFLFLWTASLLRHPHYLIPSAYYLLLTSSLGLFISLGQLYLVRTIYASY